MEPASDKGMEMGILGIPYEPWISLCSESPPWPIRCLLQLLGPASLPTLPWVLDTPSLGACAEQPLSVAQARVSLGPLHSPSGRGDAAGCPGSSPLA